MRSIQFFLAVLIVGTMLSAVLAAQRTEMSGTPTSSPPRALVDTFDVTHAYTRCYGGSYTERNPLVRSDRAGNVLLCGGTGSKDFPQIPWEKEYNEYDASVFVMKLRPEDGSIIYSRRFGSTSTLLDVEIGKDDRVIVLLENPYLDPILTPDAQWSTRTPIGMVVLDSAGTMIYCSYLRTDLLYDVVGMECSARGDLFILATTHATPPMATPDALFPSHQGGMDGFLMKFSSEDYRLVYASCFGGPGDDAYYSLATDGCSVVLIGTTMSNGYPLMHPLQDRIYGGRDFILSRISADGQEIIWSTYLGSSGQETGISEVRFLRSICFDDAGNLTFIGQTDSRDFPVTDVISSFGEGRQDIVLCRISPEGRLDFSTHLGTSTYDYAAEIAVDACGHVIVTGESDGSTFPLVHPLMTEGSSFLLVIDTEQPSLLFSTRMGSTRDQRRGCVTMLHDTTLFAVASADSGAMLPVTIGGPAHSNGTDIYLSAFTMPELCSLSPFTEFADRYPEVSAEIITQDTLLIELRRQVSWPVEFPISIRLRNHSPDVSSDPISVGLTLPTGLELALGSLPPQMSLPGLQPLEQRIVTWTVRAYQKAITPDTVVSFVLSYHVSGDCPRSDVIETGIPVKYTDLFYADLRCTLDVPAPPSLRPDSLRLVSETTVLTLRIRNHTDAEAPLRAVRLSFPVEGGVTLANPAEIERTVPPIPPLDSVTLSWTLRVPSWQYDRYVLMSVVLIDTFGFPLGDCWASIVVPGVRGSVCELSAPSQVECLSDGSSLPSPIPLQLIVENLSDTMRFYSDLHLDLSSAPHLSMAAGDSTSRPDFYIRQRFRRLFTWNLGVLPGLSSDAVDTVHVRYRTESDTAWHSCVCPIRLLYLEQGTVCTLQAQDSLLLDPLMGRLVPDSVRMIVVIRNTGEVEQALGEARLAFPPESGVTVYGNVRIPLSMLPPGARDTVDWYAGIPGYPHARDIPFSVSVHAPDDSILSRCSHRLTVPAVGPFCILTMPDSIRYDSETQRYVPEEWTLLATLRNPSDTSLGFIRAVVDTSGLARLALISSPVAECTDVRPHEDWGVQWRFRVVGDAYPGDAVLAVRYTLVSRGDTLDCAETVFIDGVLPAGSIPASAQLQLESISPNPVQIGAPVMVTYRTDPGSLCTLRLQDMLGRRVQTISVPSDPEGRGRLLFTTTGVPAGTYLLTLTDHTSMTAAVITLIR